MKPNLSVRAEGGQEDEISKEQQLNELQEEISGALYAIPFNLRYGGKNGDRRDQLEAIHAIDLDFVNEMRAHLKYEIALQEGLVEPPSEYFQKEAVNEQYVWEVLQGEVFEYLIARDPKIVGERNIQTEGVASELETAVKDKKRYGLEGALMHKSIPDFARIKINDKGKIIILGFIEAKSGEVTEDIIRQLYAHRGCAEDVTDVLNDIGDPETLEDIGMIKTAERIREAKLDTAEDILEVSDNFLSQVVVPSDKKGHEVEGVIGSDLKGIKIDVVRASFTRPEIRVITGLVLEKIKELESENI